MNRLDIKRSMSALPEYLQEIPEEVRKKTGIEVEFKEPDAEFKTRNPGMAATSAGVEIDPDNNSIIIWLTPAGLEKGALIHELLHLKRNIIDSVLKIFPNSSSPVHIQQQTFFLENDFEHLFILPEEILADPEREKEWVEVYKNALEKSRDRVLSLYMHWLVLNIALPNQTELIAECKSLLHGFPPYDVFGAAESLRNQVQSSMPDKHKMLNVLSSILRPELRSHMLIGRYVSANGRLTAECLGAL
ncbi:hypothetical protein [Massilia suwonensis]|uniref:IrrE N-terminal-like domain-containing protein n=1 Tax=Massilia suwonensis TaxID=648895 RepID=A0ABW0MT91_9BURK